MQILNPENRNPSLNQNTQEPGSIDVRFAKNGRNKYFLLSLNQISWVNPNNTWQEIKTLWDTSMENDKRYPNINLLWTGNMDLLMTIRSTIGRVPLKFKKGEILRMSCNSWFAWDIGWKLDWSGVFEILLGSTPEIGSAKPEIIVFCKTDCTFNLLVKKNGKLWQWPNINDTIFIQVI